MVIMYLLSLYMLLLLLLLLGLLVYFSLCVCVGYACVGVGACTWLSPLISVRSCFASSPSRALGRCCRRDVPDAEHNDSFFFLTHLVYYFPPPLSFFMHTFYFPTTYSFLSRSLLSPLSRLSSQWRKHVLYVTYTIMFDVVLMKRCIALMSLWNS